MTNAEATAEVFYLALKALPRAEREATLVRIAQDKVLARDLIDLAVIADRRQDRSRSIREYFSEKKKI